MAFAWLVAKASWKPTRVRYKDHIIELGRGDLSISIRDLSLALDRPKGWVERLISRLKSETMIRTRRASLSKTAPLIISLVNYDTYQSKQDSDGTRDGTRGGTRLEIQARHAQDREQRSKEVKKEEPIGKPIGTRATKIADGWVPPALTGVSAKTVAGWSPDRLEQEAESFTSHHRAKGSLMKDWDAAWRTWVGNSVKFQRQSSWSFGSAPANPDIPI